MSERRRVLLWWWFNVQPTNNEQHHEATHDDASVSLLRPLLVARRSAFLSLRFFLFPFVKFYRLFLRATKCYKNIPTFRLYKFNCLMIVKINKITSIPSYLTNKPQTSALARKVKNNLA